MSEEATPKTVRIELEFSVHDAGLLREVARRMIEENGMGHEYDPDDLADCLVEALLHSNPGVPGYLDYGVELVGTWLETR
jgi:hypothetical protein